MILLVYVIFEEGLVILLSIQFEECFQLMWNLNEEDLVIFVSRPSDVERYFARIVIKLSKCRVYVFSPKILY